MLYRVFPHVAGTEPRPLAVPRAAQGAGRHDNPDHYLALYLARDPVAAVAERIQAFRGQELADGDLRRAGGGVLTLATIDDGGIDPGALVDLDDPATLVRDRLRPSHVASLDRARTQRMALGYFERDAVGLSWWSTLRADWTNVTLFDVRVAPGALTVEALVPLTVVEPIVVEAAARIGVNLPRARTRTVPLRH